MKLLLLTLPWHILTWADFKEIPHIGTYLSASSNTVISWTYIKDDRGYISEIEAEPYFDPYKSWTITNDPLVLKHEQGHLDICKIVCNEIFRNVNPTKKYTDKEFLKLKSGYEKEWNDLDDNYDNKTSHSRNRQAQIKWDSWIAEQLTASK